MTRQGALLGGGALSPHKGASVDGGGGGEGERGGRGDGLPAQPRPHHSVSG